MKLFTNAAQTRLFATDRYVNNLRAIEVNSIGDLVQAVEGIDINVLIGNRFFQADDIGELIITEDDGFNPVTPFKIDFLESMTAAEIVAGTIALYEYGDTAKIIAQIKALWEYGTSYEDGLEDFLFVAGDGSKLLININHFAATIKATSYLKTTNLALLPPFR